MISQINEFVNNLPDLFFNILIAFLAVLTGLVLKFFLRQIFNYYARISDNFLIKIIIKRLRRPMSFFLPLLMLNLALPLMRMEERYYAPVSKSVEILFTIFFAIVVIQVIGILEDYFYHRYDFHKDDNLKERKIRTQLQFVRKVLISLVVLITAGIILLSFESLRKIGAGMLTGVGIGGIIIGLAAQKSLGNLLAGFQIAFTQPIRIDDVLVVEGEWGKVEDITLTYVVLNIWDQRRLILPINYFIEKPFQNWTRISSELIGTVFLYLDYTAPVEKIRTELSRLLDLIRCGISG
ncbi:mechanosensitive ion channel family protein [Daejeonella oryzae]|uniref:mechanosensitive ion channel family protein n=1 Tax=Daejeonella oryzae TaxID=1122943 RepID=UPI0004254137|nr:mechanosensitive ion channel domain-containing protein [Daejeonella oryzae]